MYIWLKINSDFGFVGASYGEGRADIDAHVTHDEFDRLVSPGAYDELCHLINDIGLDLTGAYELTDSAVAVMARGGWTRAPALDGGNGDIFAPSFRR